MYEHPAAKRPVHNVASKRKRDPATTRVRPVQRRPSRPRVDRTVRAWLRRGCDPGQRSCMPRPNTTERTPQYTAPAPRGARLVLPWRPRRRSSPPAGIRRDSPGGRHGRPPPPLLAWARPRRSPPRTARPTIRRTHVRDPTDRLGTAQRAPRRVCSPPRTRSRSCRPGRSTLRPARRRPARWGAWSLRPVEVHGHTRLQATTKPSGLRAVDVHRRLFPSIDLCPGPSTA